MEWKQVIIDGEEWGYEVSDSGLIRNSLNGRLLKPFKNNGGYLQVMLCKNGCKKNFLVHRLVAIMFCDGYFEGAEVNHINENRYDNRADNLEWMTHNNNINYGSRTEKASKSKQKKVMAISLTETKVIVFQSMTQAEKIGFQQTSISKCCNGKLKSHKGYTWKIID